MSHYGRSKRWGEHAAESLPTACRQPSSARRSCWARAIALGLPLFRSVIRFGVHLSPGFKPQRFSVIHADDLVQLLILAAERGQRLPPLDNGDTATVSPPGRAIILPPASKTRPMPIWAGSVAESVGRRVLVIPAAMPVVRTVAAVGEADLASRRATDADEPRQGPRNRRRLLALFGPGGQDELGFAVGAPLIERLRQTAEWYRREGWL